MTYVPLGVAGGLAVLDGTGAIPLARLPAAVVGSVAYQGTWNASTNTPTITSSTGTKGYYYVVSVAGSTDIDGVSSWALGDWIIFNGVTWQKVDNTDAVTSVNSQTGAVSLGAADVGAPSTTGAGASGTWGISVSGNAANVTGTVAVANGGTGATTLTANNVLLGNGTSAVQAVAPGNSGNVLTSNGTSWVSQAPAGGSGFTTTTTAISKTIAAYERCFVTAAAQTITLPAAPAVGVEVTVGVLGFADTIVARNGSNIMSIAEDFTIDQPNTAVTLVYVDSSLGWRII